MMRVYTLGYAAKDAYERLTQLMVDPRTILIDIRASIQSRFHPRFRGSSLAKQFGNQYHHVPELGNVNYRDHTQPIQIADPVVGLPSVGFWLQRGYTVCLLCACSKPETCHRSVVAHLLQERYGCDVVHL